MAAAKPKAKKKPKGGFKENAGRPEGSANKTPRDLMNDMGCPADYMTPVEFCMAVLNNDLARLKLPKTKKGGEERVITIGQRLEASRIATPYFHQKLPEIVDLSVTDSWADMIRKAEERQMRMMKQYEKG